MIFGKNLIKNIPDRHGLEITIFYTNIRRFLSCKTNEFWPKRRGKIFYQKIKKIKIV